MLALKPAVTVQRFVEIPGFPGLVLGIGPQGTGACALGVLRDSCLYQDIAYTSDVMAPQSKHTRVFPSEIQVYLSVFPSSPPAPNEGLVVGHWSH